MVTGLSLENLAQIIHTDKQRMYAEERFVRQVELAQRQSVEEAACCPFWRECIEWMAAHHPVVRSAVRPLRLFVQ